MSQHRGNGEGSWTPSSDGWGTELGWLALHSPRQQLRASSPLFLTHLDMRDKKSHFRAQSPVWSSKEGVSGSGISPTRKANSPGSDSEASLRNAPGMRRWQSLSRLGPEGAPRSLPPSPGAELRAALMQSGARRAELVQRLREAQERLDSQTDLLKARDTQLHHSHTSTQLLELRQKQLADAVSALEQEKEAAELSRFEESRRRGELQDKVLQLELDMLKMRSTLEKAACTRHTLQQALSGATYSSPLRKTLPTTQEDFCKQGRRQMERELRAAREALIETQERLQSLEEERDQAQQDLCSAKENQRVVQSQVEEARERLSSSLRAQSELLDQLNEARNHQGQASLERDLLSSKVLRIEDNLEDVKLKLSSAMADKDRIMQEKADLHQRAHSLELQLERAQCGREGFTDQVCELHRELVDTKAQANRQEQEKAQMMEELLTLNESHKTMSTELREARQRLEAVLGQLHKLEGERVIHTNQIAALETERSQLIGEKEELELVSTAQQSSHEEVTELRQSCCQLRESQNSLLLENQELESKCQALEAGILGKEVELQQKEAELQKRKEDHAKTEAGMAETLEELRRVGVHWKERWQEVAMALRTTQDQLEDTNRQHSAETSQLEAGILGKEEELRQKEAELLRSQEDHTLTEAGMVQEVEDLRRVGTQWKERWQEATVALKTSRGQLEETGRKHAAATSQLRQEAAQLAQELEKLQKEAQSSQEQMQTVLQQKADVEAELDRVKKDGGALVKVELDACRQQLDLEKSRSQALLRQLSSSPERDGRRGSLHQESPSEKDILERTAGGVRNHAADTQDRGTETDLFISALGHVHSLQISSSQQDIVQALSASSLQEVDGELGQMRAELQKVWDMLRERDTELEEHQQELLSARGQVSQQNSEVQRLEQQLTEREEELEKKEQALRSTERRQEAERTETQITISSLEMKLAELMELGVTETDRRGSPECSRCSGPATSHPDALQAELEELRNRNAQLQQERDKVVQTLQQLQQLSRKTEKVRPENKKEICPGNLDHDKQRRLVTEQLKSLFKEKEQLTRAYDTSAAGQTGSRSLQEWTTKSKVIKNAVDTLASQKRREHELQQGRNSRAGAAERAAPNGQQGAPDIPALQGMQEQMARLKEELHSKTDKMSAVSVEICNLRERNENLLTAKLRFQQEIQGLRGTVPSGERLEQGGPHLSTEEKMELEPSSNTEDGTYLAKQVNVGGSEEEEGDEEETEERLALLGEAEESSLQDCRSPWDGFPSPACTNVTSRPLFRACSADTLNLTPPSAPWSPDLSPLFPRSWAGSQECLLSPRPYRSQSNRSLPPAESHNGASSSPRLEPE